MADFFEGKQDLFPADGGVAAAFGEFGSWAGLLKDEPLSRISLWLLKSRTKGFRIQCSKGTGTR